MTARDDPGQHGHRLAQTLRGELGRAILQARLDAGISQLTAAMAAGMSRAQLGRIERADNGELTIEQLCRAAAAVGLRLAAKTYPDGDPARDAGQLALLGRFRARVPAEARWQTEVPLPIRGDRRSWDAVVTLGQQRIACEAETRPRDIQALQRRLALKMRDGGIDLVLLVISDTEGNRRMLDAHRAVLRPLLPLDTRAVLRTLRAGELPDRGGVVVL